LLDNIYHTVIFFYKILFKPLSRPAGLRLPYGGKKMSGARFLKARKALGKTQKEMAVLLGVSMRAVHSYEQGWRKVPSHVERQVYFLLSQKSDAFRQLGPCWEIRGCDLKTRSQCPAWEFDAGKLCWLINGTFCEGAEQQDWEQKMKICRKCPVLKAFL
jgi:DNA-binding transcriptional regulator YiaG